MKITKEQFKNIVKEVMTEETEYQAFFSKALEKSGKSIPDMSDEEKKAFFDKIDSAWNGKGEKSENASVNEETSNARILGIDFNISETDNGILFSFKDKSQGNSKVREYGSNKIINLIQNSLDKAFGKGEFFFKGGTHSEFQNGYLFRKNQSGIKLNKLKFESVIKEEEEIKWNAVENAIINFLKANTKILDKRVKDRDTDGVKGGLQSIIDGLTNAQRSLKLK